MSISILDTCVLVKLAQLDDLVALKRLKLPAATTDIVDGEMTAERNKYPDAARYETARDAGMIAIHSLSVGSPAYAEFLRLRGARTNPRRNRGEDSCVALAIVTPGSFVYLDDHRGTNMATRELGVPRVLNSSAI